MLCPMVVSAQEADTIQVTKQVKERAITGTLIDKESKEGIMQVTIQLLKTDSTYVAGSISDVDGHFSVKAPENGKYILKMSVIGYKTMTRDITISNDNNFKPREIKYVPGTCNPKNPQVYYPLNNDIEVSNTYIYR